jgi:8-oxo-dGTP diphosphatase
VTVDARHCPRCGAALAHRPPVACGGCGYQMFVNARPTANLVVLDGDRFLSVRRAAPPRQGLWELPGGFCDGWEHPREAAVREAREELGVEVLLGDLVGMYLGDYEFQGERLPVLDCFWLARIAAGRLRLDPAEASAFTWLPLADPPPMAFPTMDRALADAARMRSAAGPASDRHDDNSCPCGHSGQLT